MTGFSQHRLVFAIHIGNNISDWFNLPCVVGVRKDDSGELIVFLKDVVRDGLQRIEISRVLVNEYWLCHDEENRWWVLKKEEYAALDKEQHVTLFKDEYTRAQVYINLNLDKFAKVKNRLAKYDNLRITEDSKGLYIYNITNKALMLLYRMPRTYIGKYIYGCILKSKNALPYLLGKEQFDRAIKRLLELALKEDENKNIPKLKVSDL